MTIRQKVKEFHEAMDIPVISSPSIPADDRVRLRASLIAEEFFEVMVAMFGNAPLLVESQQAMSGFIAFAKPHVDLESVADGLCDLDYVIEGTRLELGIDGGPVLDEVHAANMRKVGGPVRDDGKRLKPEGWQPPDIARVLREQRGDG